MNKWEKPQLIILARGNPEESVLTVCKTNNPNSPLDGADRQQVQQCSELTGTSCQNCQARPVSSDT